MKPGQYSYMAEATARMRAAHQLLDDEPKILSDPLAVRILGPRAEQTIRADAARYQEPTLKRSRTLLVVRARYVEDELQAALQRGMPQLVVLGAGLDTLPYRIDRPGLNLRMFEVDHPDTQRWKLGLLEAAGLSPPDSLSHVAVDFERQSLADELLAAGFDPSAPAFFSWLGVSYYLERPAVTQMFAFVASMPSSSQIVFDFLLDESQLDAQGREAVACAGRVADRHREPLRTRFRPDSLCADLRRLGFRDVTWLDPETATQRYLRARSDGLSLDPSLQLVSAVR